MPMGLARKVQSLNQVTGPQAGAGRLCSDLLCDSWTIPDVAGPLSSSEKRGRELKEEEIRCKFYGLRQPLASVGGSSLFVPAQNQRQELLTL